MNKISLHEFEKLAYHSFVNTSFDPEKLAKKTIEQNECVLNDDLNGIPEEEKERYINGYKKYFSSWLSAHSRCASSFITGRSKFDTQRAERANEIEQKRYEEFRIWRERALKAIKRQVINKSTNNKVNIEISFVGGKIIQNWEEDRIQLLFIEKPDAETILLLKKNGFHWSPTRMVWQRKNTNNAINAAKQIIGVPDWN